jgi:hypothetical protein
MLFLGTLALAAASFACAAQDLRIVVANYGEAWELTLDPATSKAHPVSSSKRKSGEEWPDELPAILRDLEAKHSFRRSAIAGLDGVASAQAKWAEFSPDCKLVVVGYEDSRFEVARNVAYGRAEPWKQLGDLRLRDYNFLLDVAWSSDSRFLVLLETEERYSKSLRGLLSGFFGHPIPLETLFVTIVDLTSGGKQRFKLLSDVPYATVALQSPKASCHHR